MKCIIFITLLFSLNSFAMDTFDTGWVRPKNKFDYSDSNKIVIHLNILPNENQLKKMQNAFDHLKEESPNADVKILIHGPAIELMLAKDKTKKEFLDKSQSKGIQFLVCHNTMKKKKIKLKQLYKVKADDVVPAGLLELARLQQMGYSYIRLF